MANCVNKNLKEVKQLADKFNVSSTVAATIIGAWQERNNVDLFPNSGQFQLELISNAYPTNIIDDNALIKITNDRIERNLDMEEPTSLSKSLQNIEGQEKLYKEVEDKMNTFLSNVGINVSNVSNITDSDGNIINAIAKADIINKTVEVIEEKRDITTLPEETAHVFVKLLGENNPLYTSMMDKISRFKVYSDVLEEYGDVYNNDDIKIREEAIGKLIASTIVNQEIEDRELNKDLFTKWWTKVWNWIKNALGGLKSIEMSPFIEAAKDILEGNVNGLLSLDQVIDANRRSDGLSYYQLSQNLIDKRNNIINALDNSNIEIDYNTGDYITKDGRVIKTSVPEYVKAYHGKMFNRFYKGNNQNELLELKISYVSAINSSIMNDLINGKSLNTILEDNNRIELTNKVANRLTNRDKDFVEAIGKDPKFFFLEKQQFEELANGMHDIYEQIQYNNERINSLTGQSQKAKLYTDLSVYNKAEDLAGTIDLAVVYSNGTVGLYDYKGIRFKTNYKTNIVEDEISQYKLEEYDLYMHQFKNIFKEQYGVKDFAETRVIPMNIQLNRQSKLGFGVPETTGIKKIEIGDKLTRKYLRQIPVADELTIDPELNRSLKKLFALRDKYRHQIKNNESFRTKANLDKIDESIKELQLSRNIVHVYNDISRIQRQLFNRESAPKGTPDYLELVDLNDYMEIVDVYRNFNRDSIKISQALKPELASKIKEIPNILDEIQSVALDKIIERLNEDEDIDITTISTETGFIGRQFKRLHEFDQPTFRKMAKLVTANAEETRRAINEIVEVMTTKQKALEEWAKSKNMSLLDTFNIIYNKEKGRLINQYESNYMDELSNARTKRNKSWLLKNTTFDVKTFNSVKEKYFKNLDKIYIDADQQDKKNEVKLQWEKKFDINKYEEAMFFHRNSFMRLKDNSKYHTNAWKTLITPGNEALKDYYDTYIEYNKEFNELVGRHINKGFVAELRQDTIDRLAQTGTIGMGSLFKNLQHSLELREFDISQREIDPSTGKPRPVIPLFFMDKVRDKLTEAEEEAISQELIEDGFTKGTIPYNVRFSEKVRAKEYEKGREYKSYDLTKSLILFAESVYTNKHANETEEAVIAIQNLMRSDRLSRVQLDASGKEIIDTIKGRTLEVAGLARSDIEAFDKFVNVYWYGLTTQNKDFEFNLGGKKISGNKALKLLMNYTSAKALVLNPVLAAGNVIGLATNAIISASEGIMFNKNQLTKAFSMTIKKDKIGIMAKEYFETSARNLTYEKANNLSASKLSQTITMDNAYILHKKPDDAMDNIILLAMMQNYGFDSEGSIKRLSRLKEGTKSLIELSSIQNDKFILPGITDNKENFDFFRRYVRTASIKIKGAMPEDNRNLIGTTIWGSMLMQFRNWIPGLAETRFKKIRYDADMQELDVGRFNVLAGEIFKTESFKDSLSNLLKLTTEIMISLPLAQRFFTSRYNVENQNTYGAEMAFESFLERNPHLRDKLTLKDYLDIRASKLKGVAKELSMFLGLLLLVAAIGKGLPDDEDDESSVYGKTAQLIYNAANRGLLESSFWFDPKSAQDILTSPMPSLRILGDIGKLASNTLDVARDLVFIDDSEETFFQKKGGSAPIPFVSSQRDRTPMFYRTIGMIPGLNGIEKMFNLLNKPIR